jgi:uncharacterized protein
MSFSVDEQTIDAIKSVQDEYGFSRSDALRLIVRKESLTKLFRSAQHQNRRRCRTSLWVNQRPLRIVFDTNVFIAALLLPGGYCDNFVYESAIGMRFILCTSLDILNEFKSKVSLKFIHRSKASEEMLTYVTMTATIVNSLEKLNVVEDEPDNKILECAIASKADLIATFDKDLLRLKKFREVAIIHPSQLQDYFPRR